MSEQKLTSRRRNSGKVAHLPRRVRDRINKMLDDGLTYSEIIGKLGKAGEHLTRKNLGCWHRGGHQLWLEERTWLREMRATVEFACEVARTEGGSKLHEAILRIAVKQLYELMLSFKPVTLAGKLADNPSAYARLLHALSGLTEAGLKYELRRDDDGWWETYADDPEPGRKRRGLSEKTRLLIEKELNLKGHALGAGEDPGASEEAGDAPAEAGTPNGGFGQAPGEPDQT